MVGDWIEDWLDDDKRRARYQRYRRRMWEFDSDDLEEEHKFPTIRCTLEPALPYRGKKRYTILEIPELKATVHPWLEAARWYLLRGHDPETPITFRIKGDRRTEPAAFIRAAQKEARERLWKEVREREWENENTLHAFIQQGLQDITKMEFSGRAAIVPEQVGRTLLGHASCLWITDEWKQSGLPLAWEVRTGRETRKILGVNLKKERRRKGS
jgi:hypothetical protein